MKIAVLFDGAGIARLGLEQARHDCIGFEIDPIKVELGSYIGSGAVELTDAQSVDLRSFDAVWASPPCQPISAARTQGNPKREYDEIDYLNWCRFSIQNNIVWIENVIPKSGVAKGTVYNAAQFSHPFALQNRNRVIEGRYRSPHVLRPYKRTYNEAIPTVMATEYKYGKSERRRAGRAFGRKITIEEAAYYQGFEIPKEWYKFPDYLIYEAIGDAVPTYMSKAFGDQYES